MINQVYDKKINDLKKSKAGLDELMKLYIIKIIEIENLGHSRNMENISGIRSKIFGYHYDLKKIIECEINDLKRHIISTEYCNSSFLNSVKTLSNANDKKNQNESKVNKTNVKVEEKSK